MKAPRTRIATTIADRLSQGQSADKVSKELAAYLLQEGRIGELDSIMRDVIRIRAERGEVLEVIATSSHELDAAARADITAQAKKLYPSVKEVIISSVHDETVVGGVRLEFAGQQLDLSIRAKLNRFKQLTTA